MGFRCLGVYEREFRPLLHEVEKSFAQRTGHTLSFIPCVERLELYTLAEKQWDAVLVALSGAEGMEAANSVREANPGVPLVWVSDDKAFGVQSYRLRAQMFLCLPVKKEEVVQALVQCFEKQI